MELLEWLTPNFTVILPSEICSIEDMNNASKLMLRLSSSYSYLVGLSSAAKVLKREIKRGGKTEDFQDMVDRCEIIQGVTDIVEQQYAAISRAVTIHIENNKELKMNCCGVTNI
jgi:hypothetical protein